VSILVEFVQNVQTISLKKENVVGLDFDMKNLYTDSQCIRADYPRFYRRALEKLAREQPNYPTVSKEATIGASRSLKLPRSMRKLLIVERIFFIRSREN